MKKIAIAAAALLSLTTGMFASERRDADLDRLQTSSTVLSQIMSAPDRAIPDSIMSGAKCIAIIPSSMKASFIFGANYGKGVATCRTEKGWSSPTFFKLTGGSFGFQIGGQATDLVLIAVNDRGMQALLKSKFKIGGDAAASAGPVGRNASAATNLTMKSELLTYSRSQGLFAGIDLNGTVVNQNTNDTRTFYGHDVPFQTILKGDVATPAAGRQFVRTVARYFQKSK